MAEIARVGEVRLPFYWTRWHPLTEGYTSLAKLRRKSRKDLKSYSSTNPICTVPQVLKPSDNTKPFQTVEFALHWVAREGITEVELLQSVLVFAEIAGGTRYHYVFH